MLSRSDIGARFIEGSKRGLSAGGRAAQGAGRLHYPSRIPVPSRQGCRSSLHRGISRWSRCRHRRSIRMKRAYAAPKKTAGNASMAMIGCQMRANRPDVPAIGVRDLLRRGHTVLLFRWKEHSSPRDRLTRYVPPEPVRVRDCGYAHTPSVFERSRR